MHNECWKKLTKQIKFFFVISEWIDEDRVLFYFFYFAKRETFFVMNRNVLKSFRILLN